MKLTRHCPPLKNRNFLRKQRTFCASTDLQFVASLTEIVRGNQSWRVAFNNSFISQTLKPHHVEKVLVQTLDDSRLALRFFNFLGLHKNFNHSTTSFCILIHALVQSSHYWPASSLLQTLLLRGLNPEGLFESFLDSYRRCNVSTTIGFDLLIQTYVQNRREADGLLIVKLMMDCELLPQIRTLSGVLNGLIRIRQFHKVLHLFDETVNSGLRPDVYVYTAVVQALCELKDFTRAREVIQQIECCNV